MYSFGYGNYYIVGVSESLFYIGNKFVLVKFTSGRYIN